MEEDRYINGDTVIEDGCDLIGICEYELCVWSDRELSDKIGVRSIARACDVMRLPRGSVPTSSTSSFAQCLIHLNHL